MQVINEIPGYPSKALCQNEIDISGNKYGMLTVLYKTSLKDAKGHALWLSRCDCGNLKLLPKASYACGNTKSCGCNTSEWKRQAHTTHGSTPKRLHKIWEHMKWRCCNPNCEQYKNYGGRGITICAEWSNYAAFREWALTHGYADNLTIERIDVNGNYCPENCTFIPNEQQVLNRRPFKSKYFNGERVSIKQLCLEHGIDYSVVKARLTFGWDVNRALNTPNQTKFKLYDEIGKRIVLTNVAQKHGISVRTLRLLVKHGVSLGEAIEVLTNAKCQSGR